MAMEIELHEVTVRQVVEGYTNHGEEGVYGLGGKLDIRPQYQRNFIYDDEQRDEVVRTVKKNFPLNVMYWVIRDDGTFEVMDGQQRTISICDYVKGVFAVDGNFFQSLSKKFQETILNYKLTIYFCRGDDDEKLAWFKVVNIAGEKLFNQEILNATYAGKFVNEARAYFSQRNCAAYRLSKDYLRGEPIRQEILETALKWICDLKNCSIEEYMSKHKSGDAEELKKYFRCVFVWVKRLFPIYHKEMREIDWGKFFNRYGGKKFDVEEITRRVEELRDDDEVQSMSGIYKYLLTGEEKHLSLRAFDKATRKIIFNRQGGQCAFCGKKFKSHDEMEADHIKPWSKGGKTIPDNCQMLCKACNRRKGNR